MNYNSTIYVLSCDTVDKKGGIYAFDLTDDGKLKKKDYLPCDRPMYAVKCSKGLGVLLRAPYDRINFSGYFYVDEKLKNSTDIKSTQGLVACHLCINGEELYSANYSSGSISKNDTLLEISRVRKGLPGVPSLLPCHTHRNFPSLICLVFSNFALEPWLDQVLPG